MADVYQLPPIDLSYLASKLTDAQYNPVLGVRKIDLGKTIIGNVATQLILIQLDPGKELRPHFHETEGGEIWLPLTTGTVFLGNPQKTPDGQYKTDNEQKITVDWDKPITLTPFSSIEVPVKIAHYIVAPSDKTCILVIFLPVSHPTTDIKYTTHPL